MATRKSASKSATGNGSNMPDAYVNARTPAEAARALGVDGKWLRNILRTRVGVYVSRGGVFDAETKSALFDIASKRIEARNATS